MDKNKCDKEDIPIQCKYCNKWLRNRKNYNRHKVELHSKDRKRFYCPQDGCEQTFSRKSHIKKHLHTKHNIYKGSSDTNIPKTTTNSEESVNFSSDPINMDYFSDISETEFTENTEPVTSTSDSAKPQSSKSESDTYAQSATGSSYDDYAQPGPSSNYYYVPPGPLPEINVDDFLNFMDSNNNKQSEKKKVVIEEDIKTVTLELTKKTTRYSDGTEVIDRDAVISMSKNLNIKKQDIKVTDIVHEVENEINEHLRSKKQAKCQEL